MITEDYVSFEVAKLLKEKGFDEPCFAYYYVMPHKTVIAYDKDFPKNSDLCLIYANIEFGSLPTLQMVMKWLREVYKYLIVIGNKNGNYLYLIKDLKANIDLGISNDEYIHYEEAYEAAIEYCLTNLI